MSFGSVKHFAKKVGGMAKTAAKVVGPYTPSGMAYNVFRNVKRDGLIMGSIGGALPPALRDKAFDAIGGGLAGDGGGDMEMYSAPSASEPRASDVMRGAGEGTVAFKSKKVNQPGGLPS